MASAQPLEGPVHHLAWSRTSVQGRPAAYGTAGVDGGLPVVFLHGWALGSHAYKRSLQRLVQLECQVFAPALPGFGGTADLPRDAFSMDGVDEPVFLVGHSFGGGVAIQFAHDHAQRVRTLVLINSVGGSAWARRGSAVRSMAERPLWDWGIHFPRDVLPFPQVTRVLPVILEDALPNLIRNPRAVWRVANLARAADLTDELEELKRRELPVLVLWGEQDKIIPRESFDALCAAIGTSGEVVSGNHSWLLADPDSFGEVMTNIVEVARIARDEEAKRGPGRRSRRPRRLKSISNAKPSDEE